MILDKLKSICIVGSGHTILGRKLGNKIDKHFVARFNHGLPHQNKEFLEDIGERTDIIMDRKVITNTGLDMAKAKYLFTNLDTRPKVTQKKYHLDVDGKHFKDFGVKSPAKNLSSGLAFIRMCLKHKIPNIYIVGFTTEENYNPSTPSHFCLAVKGRIGETNADFVRRTKDEGIHDFETERKIISKLIKEKKVYEL